MKNSILALSQIALYLLILLFFIVFSVDFSVWFFEPADGVIVSFLLCSYFIFLFFFLKTHAVKRLSVGWLAEIALPKMLAFLVLITATVLVSVVFSTLFGTAYEWYFLKIILLLPVLLLFLLFHLYIMDSRLGVQKDDYWSFGMALLKHKAWHAIEHGHFFRMLLLKAFFVPFMYLIIFQITATLLHTSLPQSARSWFYFIFLLGLAFDVVVAFIGYVFTGKMFNNSLLDVERRWEGWIFCLICYPPFNEFLRIIQHNVSLSSLNWAGELNWLYYLWGGVLSASWVVYWWSTLAFGLRFSNLSWRGLVQSGPYYWTRHPAYLSKNIYWWLCLLPLLPSHPFWESLSLVLGLLATSLIYYGRAMAESRHCCQFADYVNYSQQVALRQKKLFSRVFGIQSKTEAQ